MGSNKKPACVEDIHMFMTQQCGIDVAWNVLSGQYEATGMPEEYSHENIPNTLPIYLGDEMKLHSDKKASRQDIADALIAIADKNRFNPVKIMLDQAFHDGKDRFHVLEEILGIQNDFYSITYFRKWLHQTIAMALNDEENPYGSDGVLVIQGMQGEGKTFFFSKLAMNPDLFEEGVSIDLNNKDSIIQSTGVWIAELGELDSTLKREQSQLKAFITAKRDVYRLPYARASIRRIRRTSFCGTVNPEQFLNDETGSRRFWVIHVDRIDLERLKSLDSTWFQQLWRQVYEQLFLPNPQGFRLTREERAELQKRNQVFEKPLPGEIEIMDNLDFSRDDWNWYRVSDVSELLCLRGVSAAQVGKVLTKLSKTNPKILVKNTHNVKYYYLPYIRSKQ